MYGRRCGSYFNPHPLWRGWHNPLHNYDRDELISIHTLCEEGDRLPGGLNKISDYFNPHPLWRGWRQDNFKRAKFFIFQSTPSVKRVTKRACMINAKKLISIHTLCEEGDRLPGGLNKIPDYFNPHPLWRGWQYWYKVGLKVLIFQSTPSVKRVTVKFCIKS